jgi:hypothetical protein
VQVVCCARGGGNAIPTTSDEIVITLPVFKMVIAALKKAEEQNAHH